MEMFTTRSMYREMGNLPNLLRILIASLTAYLKQLRVRPKVNG